MSETPLKRFNPDIVPAFSDGFTIMVECPDGEYYRRKDVEADLKESREYALALEKELRDREEAHTAPLTPPAATERIAELEAGLVEYRDSFCEGFCKDYPAGFYEKDMSIDCSACKARALLGSKP
jgi:hypothetical protein